MLILDEYFTYIIQIEGCVDNHIKAQEESKSVRKINKEHGSFIFDIVFFFKIDMISGILHNKVSPERSINEIMVE